MNIYEEKRTFSELEECKETLTEAQADTKPASRRGNVMKSGVHSPLTGNHPLALCRIYSDGFTQATGWERKKISTGQQSGNKQKSSQTMKSVVEECGGRVWWLLSSAALLMLTLLGPATEFSSKVDQEDIHIIRVFILFYFISKHVFRFIQM